MLAAIITNLQNTDRSAAKLPTVNIDRGGGGGSPWPNYDIVDIMTATQLFPEVAGEDSFARAVRRLKWIGEALPWIKEARARREAGVFLTAAQLGYAAGYEAGTAEQQRLEVDAEVQVSEAVAVPQPVPIVVEHDAAAARDAAQRRGRDRARGDGGAGVGAALVLAALVIGGTVLVGRQVARHR